MVRCASLMLFQLLCTETLESKAAGEDKEYQEYRLGG